MGDDGSWSDASVSETVRHLVGVALSHDEAAPGRCVVDRARTIPEFRDLLFDGGLAARICRDWGEAWTANRMSFVGVTVASARLQAALRQLPRPTDPDGGTGCLLMVVPAWEGHQLAAALAADALRGRGADVRLVAGPATPEEASAMVEGGRFDGLMVSVGTDGAWDRSLAFAADLRDRLDRTIPLIAGGPAAGGRVDMPRAGGADLVTNDLDDAIAICNLPLASPAGPAGRGAETRPEP